MFWILDGVKSQSATELPAYPAFRIERGETRTLSGSQVFSSMVINGTLIVEGDTTITLMGPPIVETGLPPGLVFYLRSTGKIENELHPGQSGVRGNHGIERPGSDQISGKHGRDADPENPDDRPGDGTNGKRGLDGTDGTAGGSGWSGPALIIHAVGGGAYFNGPVNLAGSNGGVGGMGGDAMNGGGGGNGGYSRYLADGRGGDGGPGGDAGNGGQGGNGGSGGRLNVVSQGTVYLYGSISVQGGKGANGGAAGEAGDGGNGGNGGNTSDFVMGGGDGVIGNASNGGNGGKPGNGGNGGDGGTIEFYARGDILYLGVPQLMAHGGSGGDRGGNGAGGGSGGKGGERRNADHVIVRGPAGTGVHLPDTVGRVGIAGDGGRVRLLTRGSIKPSIEGRNYQLYLAAAGGQGGRPAPMDHPSATAAGPSSPEFVFMAPQDGIIPGGDGGRGGSVEVKAKGSARVAIRLQGGPGNYGADGQFSPPDRPSNGAQGGNGGTGGHAEVISPFIEINPETDIDVSGGLAGKGGYPGGFGIPDNEIFGKWGPDGYPGSLGQCKLIKANPTLFPQTSRIITTSVPADKAPVSKIVTYQYRFTNDDPDSTIEDIKLLVNWDSPYVEPVSCDLQGTSNGRGFLAFPPNLASGQILTWNFSVRVLPPFFEGVMIPCNVQIFGVIAKSPGDDFAILTLPMAPLEGFWFDIVPDKSCVLPGGECSYEVRWRNTNTEDSFSGVHLELAGLPTGVQRVSGAFSWNLGTVGPGASGSDRFTVRAGSPWEESWGRYFTINGSASATEWDGTLRLDSIHDVWIGSLGLTVASPVAELEYRGNRVGSFGSINDCSGSLDPEDVIVYFTTDGTDEDTGRRIQRENDPIPTPGLSFDTTDAARLVAIKNTLRTIAATAGATADAGPFSAVSVFYRVVHAIFEGSLPRLALHGLPNSGQKMRLEEWKSNYPDIDQSLALRQTDAVERLDVVNDIGIIAQMLADAHYPEVAEGIDGVLSVWDFLNLFAMGLSQKMLMGNRIAGVLGTEATRMGAVTGQASDMLVNSTMPGIGKKLGVNSLLSGYLQGEALGHYLNIKNVDFPSRLLIAAQWQLGSGKVLTTLVRNYNEDPSHWVDGWCDIETIVDPAAKGVVEVLLQLIVEPYLHGVIAQGQEHLLGLNFSGSQDLALATGENVKQVLQTLSGISLRWGDLEDAAHDMAVAARDSLMWIELMPIPPMQQFANYGYYASDAVSRVAALAKVANHAEFLGQLIRIAAAGVDGVLEGSIDAFGYPITSSVAQSPQRLAGLAAPSQETTELLRLYDQVELAARAFDVSALANLAETLAPQFETATVAENLLSLQAEVLINPPPAAFADAKEITELAQNFQFAVQMAALHRMTLLRMMFALALGPDGAIQTNLLATLQNARLAEREVAGTAPPVRAVLADVSLPNAPGMVLIKAPFATETGQTITIAVTMANLGAGDFASGRLVLETPVEMGDALLSPATQEFQTAGGFAHVEWKLKPTRPGVYSENFALKLFSQDGSPLDLHTLLLSVDESGASLSLNSGQGGTLATSLDSASLVVSASAIARAKLQSVAKMDFHLLPVSSAAVPSGFVRVSHTAYLVTALDPLTATPANLAGLSPLLTLRWDDSLRPGYVNPGELKILMAETAEHWTPLDSIVDTTSRTVRANIPRAGWFTVGWADQESPAAPTAFHAEVAGGQISLRWDAVPEPDVKAYFIAARAAPDQPILARYGVRGAAAISFDVLNHPAGATRYYTVRAVDAAGNQSIESEPIRVTNGNAGLPALSLEFAGNDLVISWPANAAGFVLEKTLTLSSPAWAPIGAAPVIVNGRYTITTSTVGRTQFFRLRKP